MDILFYTDTPNYGGAEKQMEMLARHLKTLDCRVFLACGAYSILKKKKESYKKVYEDVFLLKTLHKHDPRHYLSLKKLLKKKKFDLIHIHVWNPGSCRYAFFAAKKMELPIVATEHDPFNLSGLKRIIKKNCLKKTDQIITISSDNYGQMLDNYGQGVDNVQHLKNRLNIVHNGIKLDSIIDIVDKVSIINKSEIFGVNGIKNEDFVITCVAELHERKGHKYLIDAFKKIQKKTPNSHLILVGTGPYKQNLNDYSANTPNVHFLGWRDDISQILKASDVFVLPSLKEAFGLVLLEAMACGTAVVGTNNGGIKDIIKDNECGLLVPPKNSEKLANAIGDLLKNPNKRKKFEKAALKRVKSCFTAKDMAKKTFEVYKKVF